MTIEGLKQGSYLIDWIGLRTGDVEFTEAKTATASPLKIHHNQKGHYVVYIHPKTDYTMDYKGFKFIEEGMASSVLVGPEDVPLGMVSFGKETPLFAYMHLKEIVELFRDRSGISLPLKTPTELRDEDKRRSNILLCGDMKLNPVVKELKDSGHLSDPLEETDHWIILSNPWNAERKILIIKGAEEKEVVHNIDKIKCEL